MNAKQYLSQIKGINIRLKSMVRQIQALEDALANISPSNGSMPRAATPNVHRMEGLVTAKIDLENELETESAKLAEIANTINSLPDTLHIALLTNRYVSNMEWREVALELHVCQSRVYQLHRDALAEVEKMIADCSLI